jgi:hypothetical protein
VTPTSSTHLIPHLNATSPPSSPSAMVAFSYNVTDTSPLWRYQPFPDYLGPGYQNGTGVELGWQTRWSDSGFLGTSSGSPNFGESGQGTSSHVTSNILANATLTFNGMAPSQHVIHHTDLLVKALISLSTAFQTAPIILCSTASLA